MKAKLKIIHPNVVFLKAPKGVDINIVRRDYGDDNWDMIFLEDGIACKADRVNDVIEAYQEYLDDCEE